MSNYCIKALTHLWGLFCLFIFTPSVACVGIQYQFEKTQVTVYYGETAWIPFTLYYNTLMGYKYWYVSSGLELRNLDASCPPIKPNNDRYGDGICHMALGVHGNEFVTHQLRRGYHSSYIYYKHYKCYREYLLPFIDVTVIPHPLSMSLIPDQMATTGVSFQINLKNQVNYYEENQKAGYKPEIVVTPETLNGLKWDPDTLSIRGIPQRMGHYQFEILVKRGTEQSIPVTMQVHVQPNPNDRPVFKQQYAIKHALPGKYYRLNLMELLENVSRYGNSNQIAFRIDTAKSHPGYLHVNSLDPIFLEGIIPSSTAGQTLPVSIIAHSNTGGDSLSQTVSIPVEQDRKKKPVIKAFSMQASAGKYFARDIKPWIENTAEGDSVRLIIQKIIPEAPWLHVSDSDPGKLEGVVPEEASGKQYLLTLIARSDMGGDSDALEIPLQIHIDSNKTPHFRAGRPLIPPLVPGMPFQHDFAAEADIYPDNESYPFRVRFADPLSVPDWLQLENNVLSAKEVPFDSPHALSVWVIIQNIPGGGSPPQKLELNVM